LLSYKDGECYEVYQCVKFDNITYICRDYKRATKTANHVALVNYQEKIAIVSIKMFLYFPSTKTLLGIGNEFDRFVDWVIVSSWSSSQLMRVKYRESLVIFRAENIMEKCFLIDGNKDFVCVCRVPNTVEGD